jgi:hypothetical protein
MEVIRDFIAELAPMGWQCGFEEPLMARMNSVSVG